MDWATDQAPRDGLLSCPERPKISPRLQVEQLSADRPSCSTGGGGGQAVHFVLDPDSPSWALVNEAGLRVLALCDGQRSTRAIALQIATADGLDAEELLPDVEAFLDRMTKACLLGNAPRTRPGELPDKNRFHSLALEITRACNLQCRHCYLAAGESGARELSTDELEGVIRQVKQAGGTSISIGGGEPLMRPDWRRLVEAALSLDLLVALGTNGTLIDPPIVGQLAALPIKIQLSLDGATAEVHDAIRGPGSWALTRRAIDLLRSAGKGEDLVIAFTPMRPNLHEVEALLDLLEQLEIRVVQFPPLSCSGRARRNWEALQLDEDQRLALWRTLSVRSKPLEGRMDLLADCFSLSIDRPGAPYRCNIGNQLRMDPGGNLYPCQCFHSGTRYRLGNVREQTITEVVRGERLRAIIDGCLNRPERIPACSRCRWMNLCGAGCMGNAYEANGDPLTSDGCREREQWLRELLGARIGEAPAAREVLDQAEAKAEGLESGLTGVLRTVGPKKARRGPGWNVSG